MDETRHVDPQPTRQLSIHIERRVTTAGATRVATRASRISALVGSQRVEDGSLRVDDDESARGTLRTVARTLARARYQRPIGVAKQELLLAAHEARTAKAGVAFEGPFEGEEGAAGRVLRWARLDAAVRVKGGSSDYGSGISLCFSLSLFLSLLRRYERCVRAGVRVVTVHLECHVEWAEEWKQ